MTSRLTRHGMVGWYDPRVLLQSAWMLTLSNIFGRHSDSRLIEALASQPQGAFEIGGDEAGFDFVSDVGDGFNSTYAIATALAQSELTAQDAAGHTSSSRAGEVLVFGGDEVYPYPTREAYEQRTEQPYAAAFEAAGRRPRIFALPGNHDWYDSLVAFSRTFCRPARGFAGCQTQQTRSYFALRLPGNWWLLAIDLQFGAQIDEPQEKYFVDIAAQMPADAHVIVCVPSPQWIYATSYPGEPKYSDATLQRIEREILGRDVAVWLTGDLHHYKRHEAADGRQKIISGGGGAFLHPTHVPPQRELQNGYVEKATWPDAAQSRRLHRGHWQFPWLNPRFMPLIGSVYLLSVWFAVSGFFNFDAQVCSVREFGCALTLSLRSTLTDPVNGLWLATVVGGFIFFTDTHVRWYRFVGGTLHAAMHMVAAFTLGWCGYVLAAAVLGESALWLPELVIVLACMLAFTAGGALGAWILGAYLHVSLSWFGRHSNEAFSALRIEDYKQWLRCRVRASGELEIQALGLARVPRRWRQTAAGLLADDPRATAPQLIERLVLRPRAEGGYAVHGIDTQGRRYGMSHMTRGE